MIKILHVLEFYDQVSVDLNKNLGKYKSLDYDKAIKKARDVNFSWNQLFNEKNRFLILNLISFLFYSASSLDYYSFS